MMRLTTLICSILLTTPAFAQIPNASFENWTPATGYSTPDNWANPNPYTSSFGTYTCFEGSPGFSGAHYLKLVTANVTGIGAVPGIAGTGTAALVGTTFSISGGFAYTARPAVITGEWQYAPTGIDTGHVVILLTKWNTATGRADTMAYTDQPLAGSVTTWMPFSINLNYYNGNFPDTAKIIFSASKLPPATAIAGSYLYVDTLAFAGTVPAGVVTVKNNAAPSVVYPNPATGNTNVYYYSVVDENVAIAVYDLSGKKLKETSSHAAVGGNTFPVNVSGLLHGMYLIRITDELGGVEEKKIIVK